VGASKGASVKFQDWWNENRLNYWGAPVQATRDSWNAAIEAAVSKFDELGLASITVSPENKTIRQILKDLTTEE
jgi:hypothetical protein